MTREVLYRNDIVTAEVIKTIRKWSIVRVPDGRLVLANPDMYGTAGFHARYKTMPAAMQQAQQEALRKTHNVPRSIVDALHAAITRA